MTKGKKLAPWKVLRSVDLVKNNWIRVRQETVKLPDGKAVDDYFLVELASAVLIFAVTKDNQVILERQYKHGQKSVELCLPAGLCTNKELPRATAKRELLEETGYVAKKLTRLGSFSEYATKMPHQLHAFLAENLEYQGTEFKEIMEEIDVVLVPLQELEALVRTNKIRAAGSVATIALALLKLRNRQ
jgi:8-oxo-dGTP pyrophosphatase MutT (NUDIX family)